jgi:hypothetical protein
VMPIRLTDSEIHDREKNTQRISILVAQR